MSLSKTLYLPLSSGSTKDNLSWPDWKIVNWDAKNGNKENLAKIHIIIHLFITLFPPFETIAIFSITCLYTLPMLQTMWTQIRLFPKYKYLYILWDSEIYLMLNSYKLNLYQGPSFVQRIFWLNFCVVLFVWNVWYSQFFIKKLHLTSWGFNISSWKWQSNNYNKFLALLIRNRRNTLDLYFGTHNVRPLESQGLPCSVAQSVTCLATDVSLTANQGVSSLIPAWSHTFIEIDYEIISSHSPPFHWIIRESMCTKYWLIACSSLPRKKVWSWP